MNLRTIRVSNFVLGLSFIALASVATANSNSSVREAAKITTSNQVTTAEVVTTVAVVDSRNPATATEAVKSKTAKSKESTTATVVDKNYFPKMQGCFLLYNLKTEKFEKVIGEERCKERFVACSTFKVPLAVMAFDSKTLRDENEVYKWDGVKRDLPAWNQDTNAKSWMANSVVWFSQKLTPKMGTIKVTEYLKKFKYGNEDIGSGLTDAWLKPVTNKKALKISAYEQVEFMKNLWQGKLPVSQHAMDLTKEITYLETSANGYKLNGKTGSNFIAKEKGLRFGWFISHIEKGQQEYIAVANFSDEAKAESQQFGGAQAKEITKSILKDQGLW